MNSEIPEYANNQIYQQLIAISENAGLQVSYVSSKSLGNAFAESDLYGGGIHMPFDYDFPSEEEACCILGHEIAHHLINTAQHDEKVREFFNQYDLETNCDIIGVALYQLAEKIELAEAERIFLAQCEFFDAKPNATN